MEAIDTELDRLISQRASQDRQPDPCELEPSYAESVRRFHARHRNEDLWAKLRYHEAMLESHTRTFMKFLDKHRNGVSSCEAKLGIGEDRG